MPLITVDDQGHSFYYEDSGAPPTSGDLYTTLIVVHGTAFHAQIFRRLLPFSSQYQLRLILVNRRDYPGSSPYTEEDLQKIRVDDPESHNEFGKDRANEFARFIATFVKQESVPPASSDWKRGGAVLMAWSAGNGYTIPLLAHADSIPESTRDFIEPYLRSLIIFDAPRWILGAPPIDYGMLVITDKMISEEERARRFNVWVGTYYSHKSTTSRNVEDLQLIPAEGTPTSTLEIMTAEEERETTYFPAVPRSEVAARTGRPEIYMERIRRALFDDEIAKYLPRCGVIDLSCERSMWTVIDSLWRIQADREKADREGIKGRPLRFEWMPGVNHFPHWDQPEFFMKFFADLVNT